MSKEQIYTVNGFTGNIAQIAKHFEINVVTLRCRLKTGMSIEEAVNTPLRQKHYEVYTVDGFTGNIAQIAKHFKANEKTLRARLQRGMSIEEAVNAPLYKSNKYKSKSKIYTVDGFTGNLAQIATHFNINEKTLRARLRSGMSLEEAVNTSLLEYENYTVNGFTGTIPKIAEHFGINKGTIRSRLQKGMSIKEAVSIPLRQIRIKNIEYNGEVGDLRYFCQKYNKDYVEVYNKLKHLHTLEYALESTNKPYDE